MTLMFISKTHIHAAALNNPAARKNMTVYLRLRTFIFLNMPIRRKSRKNEAVTRIRASEKALYRYSGIKFPCILFCRYKGNASVAVENSQDFIFSALYQKGLPAYFRTSKEIHRQFFIDQTAPVSVFSRVRVPGRTRPELPAVVMRLAFVFLFRLGAATNIFSDSPQRVKCKSVSRLPRIRDRAWYPSIWSPLCMTQVFLSVWVSPQERAWARHMKHMTPKRSCITCPAARLILPSGVCGRLLLQSFGR